MSDAFKTKTVAKQWLTDRGWFYSGRTFLYNLSVFSHKNESFHYVIYNVGKRWYIKFIGYFLTIKNENSKRR